MQRILLWVSAVLLFGSTATTGQPISSPTEYRPQVFDVQQYVADLTIRTPASKSVDGRVDIIVRWVNDVSAPTFPLNARGIGIDSVWFRGAWREFASRGAMADDTFHFRAALEESVLAGSTDTITVYYSGLMTTEGGPGAWGGVWYEGQVLYALGVGFHNANVSATQHWMPCYDHPSDKAAFRATFRVPRNQVVASIGILTAVETPSGDSLQAYVWEEQRPTASYLYTFAIGQFTKLELADEGTPHEYYSLSADTSASRVTYRLVPRMARLFARLFGPYPFGKIGYVNTRKGAMEHQTMISMPLSEVARQDTTSPIAAHELAHQWFGDAVSPQDFRHAWLTESFATYAEAAWQEELFGWDAYLKTLTASVKEYRESIALNEGVFPLFNFPRKPPSSNYPRTIYTKGQLVLGMMRALAGTDAFYGALRRYQEQFRYGTAITADLREAMRPALDTFTDAFFDQWVLNKGWPQLSVTMAPDHSSWRVTLRQTQHMSSLGWPLFTAVPLSLVYRDAASGELVDTMIVMTTDTLSFEVATPADFGVNTGTRCRSLVEVTSVTTVMEPQLDSYGFELHPNPAYDSATVSRYQADDDVLVEVFDAAGRQMFSAILLEGSFLLDLEIAGWPAGSYTIRMISHAWASALPLLIVR